MLFKDIKEKFEKEHPNLSLIEERYIQTKAAKRREFHILNNETGFDFWCQQSRLNTYNYNIIRYNNHEALKKYIQKITNNEYELLSECQKFSDIVKIRHKTCNTIFSCRISHFCNDNSRCPFCKVKSITKTNNDFDNDLRMFDTEGILERVSDYINDKSDITIKCKKCKKTFITKPANLRRQFIDFGELHCPNCNDDFYGEKIINEILLSLNLKSIVIKRQHSIPECRYKKPLRFDFALLNENSPTEYPLALIEYDGPQHSDPTSKYAKLSEYSLIKLRDSIKDLFCKEKGIPFIRISGYNKKNIRMTLEKFLVENNINF